VFADLHLHSFFSDGTFTPEEIVAHGKRMGFGALALTDHDTIEGCERMAAACAAERIEFIPGSELTAELGENELHILGFYLNTKHPRLLTEMAKFQAVRQQRIRDMVARINELGVPLDVESVFTLANCRAPGRPHVARALVKAGHCTSLDEAFERFLKKNRPAWAPKMKMSALEAIALIHEAGGLAVMAHPGLNRCDEVIPHLVEAGLDGIECYHTKHSSGTAAHYLDITKQYGLLVTGGSDCHGMSKGKPLIGGIKLPIHYVHKLQQAREKRAQSL
jgi:3',5'-nucleoside bisphosphate phosphatase